MKGTLLTILLCSSFLTLPVAAFDPLSPPKREKDILDLEIQEYHQRVTNQLETTLKAMKKKHQIMMKKLKSETMNVCLNGISPSEVNNQEYLLRFAEGPCAPAVMVPGITGSKLVAKINCPELRDGAPEIFDACGWKSCEFLLKPKPEYLIWVPEVASPMSIADPSEKAKKCFAGIFGQKVTGSGADIKVRDIPGVKTIPVGASPKTQTIHSKGQCGFTGIEDMLPIPENFGKFLNFKHMKEAFVTAGYKIGITLQALPYDFRIDQRNSELNKKFPKIIDTLHEITGKKVIIIAHSYGNFQAANYLWSISQEERDTKIARLISLGPPFSGSVLPIHVVIGMDDSYSISISGTTFGLTDYFFQNAIWSFKGSYALFPTNLYNTDVNKDYMTAINQRYEAEIRAETPPSGTIMDIFPDPEQTCAVNFPGGAANKCMLGMRPLTNFGSINGAEINYQQMASLLRKYSYQSRSADIYTAEVDQRFNSMENLGVQTNIIFSGAIPTVSRIKYNEDPKMKTSKGEFYQPDETDFQMGDSSVLTSSALAAGIKWADEYKRGMPGAKPVNFIEICGTHSQKTSIFDGLSSKSNLKNEYYGVACDCTGTQAKPIDPTTCGTQHALMVSDPNIVSFVLQSAIDQQTGEVGPNFKDKSEDYLQEYQNNCLLFNQ